ncbi:hypothetical protein BT67DRAFT_484715 [Trichocladium antarcticum]|uniref:TATA element modulatory factor 1 TATA binding domain-containing protein n=1 Tax=Trichocladium antarcticum TaxID=1450529 RepID=A0AAN6UFL0_9PEZI|nr:hypothetical protein BT67DRAFT_484715 [Trichocladium antarcticum]
MAAPNRWGSFLSQAVAGVEARLDTILADEGGVQEKDAKPVAQPAAAPASPAKQSPAPSRTASTRTNDRLQERLARALAAKAAGRASMSTPGGSPRQSLDAPSRNSIDTLDRASAAAKDSPKETSSPRGSQDIGRTSEDGSTAAQVAEAEVSVNGQKEAKAPAEGANGDRGSADLQPPIASPPETTPVMTAPDAGPQADTRTASDENGNEEPMKEDAKTTEDAQLRYQEEMHGYVERIDALEAKLQFLAREATDSARKAVLAAPAGSAEKKLAEKDQQIAQLMDEGKNLASTEQKHRAILKKQRTAIVQSERELNTLRAAKEKSDRELETLRSRARRAEELEKSHDELQRSLDQSQKELSTIRPQIRSKDSTIAELRTQLQKAAEQTDAAATRVNEKAREQDRRRIADLEEETAALKVEKNLVADRGKAQAADLRERAERANERARALELELKAEVQVMEAKLEAMRMRAEEASSGAAGDSQAKLLRQVETLQTQYSIAGENWQGIETTLLARITGLERERDEARQRESDMRKKAREAAVRARRNEEELEETKTKIPTIQEDVKAYQTQLDALKKRAEAAEAALAKAGAEFEKQQQAWEAEKEERQSRQPMERPRSWLEDLPGNSFLKQADSRPASPQLLAPQRAFSTDFLGIQSFSTGRSRKASAQSSNSDAGGGGGGGGLPFFSSASSRRPSAQPPNRPALPSHAITTTTTTTGGGGSSSSIFSPVSVFSPTSETAPPLPRPPQHQQPAQLREVDAFESAETASLPPSHHHQNQNQMLQDMVSVSTVAAGPSVQLVERMSAAIRRLESDKLAGREELARMARQRDEARAEMVALMRAAEGGRAAEARLAALEAEVGAVRARYETTLELLGEKSELVEELRADVEDVKAMYRDLVERTIK